MHQSATSYEHLYYRANSQQCEQMHLSLHISEIIFRGDKAVRNFSYW